jgi:hypothetical protein
VSNWQSKSTSMCSIRRIRNAFTRGCDIAPVKVTVTKFVIGLNSVPAPPLMTITLNSMSSQRSDAACGQTASRPHHIQNDVFSPGCEASPPSSTQSLPTEYSTNESFPFNLYRSGFPSI